MDARPGDEIAVGFIDDAGEERDVQTAGRRADHRSRNGVGDLNVARNQRRHGLWAAAYIDDFNVDAVLAEQALFGAKP